MNEAPKKIEVVSGNGKDLEISEVSSHLNIAKPKIKNDAEKKQEIVIPKVKKKVDKKDDNDDKDDDKKEDVE